jgi:phosphoribosylanthranilate isomerase
MSALSLKICGMRDPDNIREVAALTPDYMGFICWPGSSRFVGDEFRITDQMMISPSTRRVGVFVNQSVDEIARWTARIGCSVIQLHGEEDRELCRQVGAIAGVDEIWKAVPIATKYPHEVIDRYRDIVQRVLFDTASSARGGTGKKFDHSVLAQHDPSTPCAIAGGLSSADIPQLVEWSGSLLNPLVADFNSALEVSPGLKSIDAVRHLMQHQT